MPNGNVETAATPSAEDVQRLIQDFEAQTNQARTQMVQSGAETQGVQVETMKQAMQLLQNAGVNPADPISLQTFMQNLQETEPDAAALLQEALNAIFSESTSSQGSIEQLQ